jgi:endonuclease/exonuclease/phosphatase family metal-dependent hydrolase
MIINVTEKHVVADSQKGGTMSQIRFVVCSYNIWTTTRWPEREPGLRRFAELYRPDIFCLQELQADSKRVLDEVLLSTHQCVEDDFPGWTCEGNIYWNSDLFELVTYGAEPIEIIEEYRRFFWVRLRLRQAPESTIFVSTAHYTYQFHPRELANDQNLRIPSARKTLTVIDQLAGADEPVLFMGDLNDTEHPIRILTEGGLKNCFSALGQIPRVTYPAYPTARFPQVTIDWMFHKGPIAPMVADVVDFFEGDLSPSDHKPVIATYRL